MYNALKNTFEKWAEIQAESSQFINVYLNNFYKYGYQELETVREIQKDRDNKLQVYSKFEAKLLAKKEKLWATGTVEHWGLDGDAQNAVVRNKEDAFKIMLPDESAMMLWLKNDFAYVNYQLYSEAKRLFHEDQEVDNENFKRMSLEMSSHLSKLTDVWSNLDKVIDQIREEYLTTT